MTFVIYNKQARVFRTPILNRFLERVAVFVKEEYPEESSKLSDEELHQRIKEDYTVAKSLGVTTQGAVMRFICLGFAWERKFYEQPDFKELFAIEWADKNKCIDLVFDYDYIIAKDDELLVFVNGTWYSIALRDAMMKINTSHVPLPLEVSCALHIINMVSRNIDH